MRQRRLRPLTGSAVLLGALLFAGCSSNGTANPWATGGTTAGTSGSVPGQPVPGDSTGATLVTNNSASVPDPKAGNCQVSVTGDATANWTGAGGDAAVGYGPWYEPNVPATVKLDDSFFIVSCTGTSGAVNFIGRKPIPEKPATYTFTPSKLGQSDADPISFIVEIENDDRVWDLAAQGQLVISEFDANHIKGTFTLPVSDSLSDLTGKPPSTATVTGSFDFANPPG